jgi:hypothetical protein
MASRCRTWFTGAGAFLALVFVARQIRIAQAQSMPPALEYGERVTKSLVGTQVIFTHIAARAGTLPTILNVKKLQPFDTWTALDQMDKYDPIDATDLRNNLLGSHLDQSIHDECVDAILAWDRLSHVTRELRQTIAPKSENRFPIPKEADESDFAKIAKLKVEVAEKAKELTGTLKILQPQLAAILIERQRILVSRGKQVMTPLEWE